MPNQPDRDELLARNPQIKPEDLRRAEEAVRQLQDAGIQAKSYDLDPPFGGRRVATKGNTRYTRRHQ